MAELETYRQRQTQFIGDFALPHHLTFASVWQAVTNSYLTRNDEAKRASIQNALVMKRDAFVLQLLQARQMAVAELPFTIEVENPDQPEQKEVAEQLTKIVAQIPRFQDLKMNLLEAVWYGRAGVQLEYDYKTIDGKQWTVPVRHLPVNGDKIQYRWDGTPGIQIYRPYQPPNADIKLTDAGPVLFLSDPFYRDRFIIHTHRAMDTDYLFEADLAGEVGGVGLRSFTYWVYQLKQQILGWMIDALQRLSTNGMLIATYPNGDKPAADAADQALRDLTRNSVCKIPANKDSSKQTTSITAIPPATVAYDTLLNVVKYFDLILEKMILGQVLSSGTESTGMGSEVASFHSKTLDRIIRFDANNLAESLTRDLIQPIVAFNWGALPFTVKLKVHTETTNVKDLMTAAKALYEMGVPLDAESLREMAGLVAPKGDATAIVKPEEEKDPFRYGDEDKVGDLNDRIDTSVEDN